MLGATTRATETGHGEKSVFRGWFRKLRSAGDETELAFDYTFPERPGHVE